MSLPNGQKVWVHGNATEHMAEYAAAKAATQTPEAVRLASQEELRSFQAAVNTATKNNMPYGERITVDGWQLEIKPPRATGELPTIIANGTYQWFDLSQSGNENKSWDYKGSISSGITGALAPGRSVWANAGIALGGTLFTDGPDKGALTGTGAGWVFGTTVGLIAPPVFDPVLGQYSGFVGEVIGSVGGEFISNTVKDEVNEKKK